MTTNISGFTNDRENKVKSKHVTTACLTCRKRKIKCDTGNPSCSNCTLYNEECTYQRGIDRRKISSKDRILALEAYVRRLESLLEMYGIALPQTPDGAHTAPQDLQESETGRFSMDSILSAPDIQKLEADSNVYPSFYLPAAFSPKLTIKAISTAFEEYSIPASDDSTTNTSLSHSSWLTNVLVPENYQRARETISPLMDQLAGRMGSLQIAGDGKLRFFGATSNLHILYTGDRRSPSCRGSTNQDSQAVLDRAGVGDIIDAELESHLLRLYFAWEDPSIHVVDEEVFYRDQAKCKIHNRPSNFYSETLANAMCAVGAALTPRHCAELPQPMVEFFAARCKALLDAELDSPTLSTVSSLVIISGVEALLTRDPRGWIYSGMAMRVATDLGLHLNTQAYVDLGILGSEEAALRSMIFWGAFIHERMWSLYMGRPESLDERTITVPPPSTTQAIGSQQNYWAPYIDDTNLTNFPQLPNQLDELHHYNASLCGKMTRVRETIYADSALLTGAPEDLYKFVSSLRFELLEWYSTLPESLSVDESSITAFYLPHVLQLHMQYHCILILANRPFFSKSGLPQSIDAGNTSVGRVACTQAATSISRLVTIYRRLYTARRINIQAVHLIFTASLIHVCNACGSAEPQEKTAAWRDLEVCCQALAEIGQGYKNATRGLEVVKAIQSELLKWGQVHAKRKAAAGNSGNEKSRAGAKRRFLNDDFEKQDEEYDPAHNLVGIGDCNTSSPESDTIAWPNLPENPWDALFWSEFTNNEFGHFGP